MKNALIVAGGTWQVPIITFFRNKGYKIYVVDPYVFSDGSKLADVHVQCDVRAVYDILQKVKGIKFDIVASDQSDISVTNVAIIAEQLGLKGNPAEATQNFVNKFLM